MIVSGASIMTAVKIAGLAGSLISAGKVWSRMPEPAIRRKLIRLFKDGDICHKRKGFKNKEIRRYPYINRVTIYSDCAQAVFSLPDGIDPKTIHGHEWMFKQVFGTHIELVGGNNAKTFTLNIYPLDVKSFEYDYTEVSKVLTEMHLPIYVGRSRQGDEFYDMAEHPHLLIAGVTGSGKSVALRSILTTLIKSCGDSLRLYCADMKRSEFHIFRDVAEQVVVEAPLLRTMLMRIRKELRKRGDLLDAAGVANVLDLPVAKRPPFIVIAIDEVALLKKEEEITDIIEEISAIGRALGVFLVLSMQRPDKDVLDGKLKNNLTVRMAFRHADEINSRITLGSGEAATIKDSQKGRMVFNLDGWKYVQAPYLDVPRARALLEAHKRPVVPPWDSDDPTDDEIELGLIDYDAEG